MMRLRPKNISTCWPCIALLLCVLFGTGLSATTRAAMTTVTQYRARVVAATARLDELASLCERITGGERHEVRSQPGADTNLPLTLSDVETKTLGDVRRLLLPKEKIEWGGGKTEIDNVWLDRALQDYAQNSAKNADNKSRARMMREIVERLRALDARLGEVKESSEARARDKDAEKGRLSAILRGSDYNHKASQGGALARIIEQFIEWIRSLIPHIKPILPGANPISSQVAQIFILALGLAVIVYVVRRYYWLRRRHTAPSFSLREARVVLGERLEPEQTSFDLLSEAERMARAGDLRGAIRKAYIALLCELGDRKIIRLAQHKTNRDYLKAVRQSATPQLYREMQPLTSDFERHWYGFENATESDWTNFSTRCRQALRL